VSRSSGQKEKKKKLILGGEEGNFISYSFYATKGGEERKKLDQDLLQCLGKKGIKGKEGGRRAVARGIFFAENLGSEGRQSKNERKVTSAVSYEKKSAWQ